MRITLLKRGVSCLAGPPEKENPSGDRVPRRGLGRPCTLPPAEADE
jgi:hypothetical protein